MFFIKVKKEIQSSLTKQKVVEKLSEYTNVNDKGEDSFVGEIRENSFEIHRKPSENIRNGFRPIFFGKIEENGQGSVVTVIAKLNIFCAIFLLIWSLCAVLLPLIIGILKPVFLVAAMIMALFLVLLIIFAFYIPAKKSISFLYGIIK